MHVSRLVNHHAETRIAHRGEGGSLAREVGRLGFAGLVRQQWDKAAAASPANSAASCILATFPARSAAAAQSPSTAATNAPTAAAALAAAPAAAAHPAGTGQVTESGAPLIVLNSEPACGQQKDTNPAYYNPYFTTATTRQHAGYVTGYDKWFQIITVCPQDQYTWPAGYSATEEGAQEALRIVQQYVPEAKIQAYRFVGQEHGPDSHSIELPDGNSLNAGLLLEAYYHQGFGVTSLSDTELRVQLGWPTDAPAPTGAA